MESREVNRKYAELCAVATPWGEGEGDSNFPEKLHYEKKSQILADYKIVDPGARPMIS